MFNKELKRDLANTIYSLHELEKNYWKLLVAHNRLVKVLGYEEVEIPGCIEYRKSKEKFNG